MHVPIATVLADVISKLYGTTNTCQSTVAEVALLTF